MKYGDIILQSIRKMYLNNTNITIDEIETMKNDKKYRTYLDGIENTVNEAISILLTKCVPYIKEVEVNGKLDLSTIEDFKWIDSVRDTNGNKMAYVVANNALKTPNVGKLYYSASYKVASDTDYNEVLPIPFVDAQLIPLYVAGELYKDDDLTLSTMYLNEFEQSIANNKYENAQIEAIEDVYGGF